MTVNHFVDFSLGEARLSLRVD